MDHMIHAPPPLSLDMILAIAYVGDTIGFWR